MSGGVTATARWLDSFFEDSNYVAEEADSRLELSQSVAPSHRAATAYRTRVRGRLSLPNLSRRLSLEFLGNSDSAIVEDGVATADLGTSADEAVDDPAIGLSWIQAQTRRMHLRLSGGVRVDNPSVYVGPRLRYLFLDRPASLGRFSQRLWWDSADGWESSSRIDFDVDGQAGRLWRQSFRVDWQEEEGTRSRASTNLFQRVSSRSVLRTTLQSEFRTRPNRSWDSHTLRFSWRRFIYQDWVVMELSPFLAFEDRFDWKPNPGIRLGLELIFEGESLSPDPTGTPGPGD